MVACTWPLERLGLGVVHPQHPGRLALGAMLVHQMPARTYPGQYQSQLHIHHPIPDGCGAPGEQAPWAGPPGKAPQYLWKFGPRALVLFSECKKSKF